MKFLILLLTAVAIHVGARGYSQNISLSLDNAPIEKAFREIQKQTGYNFIYTREQLTAAHPVSLHVKDYPLQKVLALCFRNQPLDYSIEDRYIVIKEKEETPIPPPTLIDITGKVTDERGEPLVGATVTVKGTERAVATNEKGEFTLTGLNPADILIITNVGYQSQEIPVNGKTIVNIQLHIAVSSLDETVMIAYGKTTKRLNTGDVSKVTIEEISKQPVSNPIATLQGRVPGLELTQMSGQPGAGFTIRIRGQNSLTQGSDPLFVIDGIPFGAGNVGLNQQFMGVQGDLSPFNLINPADIESIEILKDADATAIYGSRGANGVILITTKKGKAGKTKVGASYAVGFSKATRTMRMLNTKEYLQMRREAFANDGLAPTAANAPDLLVWDTTRYTDFRKLFTGGTAQTSDAEMSVSGGNASTQFIINLGYHRETTVLTNDQDGKRTSVHANINHTSANRKFNLGFTTGYSYNNSDLITSDMSYYINMAPDFQLYDSSGNLNWVSGNAPFASLGLTNPLSILNRKYKGRFQNFIGNLALSYKISKELSIKLNQGVQFLNGDEISLLPKSSLDPTSSQLPSSNFITSSLRSWQTEPQMEYEKLWEKTKMNILVGGTVNEIITAGNTVNATNYSSDLQLTSMNAAGSLQANSSYNQYKYAALFGRINFIHKEKYILNITGRRDGSSRFGPGKQFANFGAIGASFIFSQENWIRNHLTFISFGKLRASYGITGNDQIGDYKFLNTWRNTSATYQSMPGLQPSSLFNPDYEWEKNKKSELALEIGLLKDRILLTTSYFRNLSANQLVNYSLPIQTGFTSVLQNFNAKIQNSGFEISLATKNILNKSFQWSSALNLSIPKNKLVSFPDLDKSTYKSVYIVGQSLYIRKTYHYLGVDPASGIYQFVDVDSNGIMDNNDKISIVKPATWFYGGLQNNFRFKGIQFDLFFEFKKQTGKNYLATQSTFIPGYFYFNQPEIVLGRWQKPGDIAKVQRYVASSSSPAFKPGQTYLAGSDAIYSDASYVRLKNVSLSYDIPAGIKNKMHIDEMTIYLQAQNLLTITNYVGADPENQNIYVLPPLKTIVAGIRITL